MCGNMGDCLVRAGNGLDSKDIIQKFGVKIPFPRRRAGNQLLRGFVQPEFDQRQASRFLSMGRNCPAISA